MDKRKYLEAILTEPGDHTMYDHNAYFHQVLDTYIEMIPIFVDGLKEHARVMDKVLKNREKALREGNLRGALPTDWPLYG
jgi:hypothetical protein